MSIADLTSTAEQVETRTLGQGNWLRIEEITYADRQGTVRTWETVARQKAAGAVFMIARLVPSDRYIFVLQFRPPVDGIVLEFPAGLVDPGEDPTTTATRELKEETGYTGEVVWMGPWSLSSPGMSRETVMLAIMTVDETLEENHNPVQECEESEDITVALRTKEQMPAFLRECAAAGIGVDSRLVGFFLGLGLRW